MTRARWRRRGRIALAWLAGAALVAVAGVVVAITPASDAEPDQFVTTVAIGERGVGRNIDITVTGARIVHDLTSKRWSGSGTWLLVDVRAATVTTQTNALLGGARLLIDGRTYTASTRMPSFLNTGLVTGVPRTGGIVFELPDGLHSGTGELAFSLSVDERADSQIHVPIDLATLPVVASAEVAQPEWAR